MEFEEIKKIWDTQNEELLYTFNEEALHQSIMSKKKKAARLNNINDFGLVAIAIITAIIYSYLSIINAKPTLYDYFVPIILICIGIYVWVGRVQRKKKERRFDRTILGDLNHAIANVAFEAKRSRTMVWWFIMPLAVPVVLILIQREAEWLQVLGVASAFILSYTVVRWDFNRCQMPKKRQLEALRDKLMEGKEVANDMKHTGSAL